MHGAGLLHGLAAGRGAAEAVHPDAEEDRRGLRSDVKNITDDGVLRDLNHFENTSGKECRR